jgi:hypothetical protein
MSVFLAENLSIVSLESLSIEMVCASVAPFKINSDVLFITVYKLSVFAFKSNYALSFKKT